MLAQNIDNRVKFPWFTMVSMVVSKDFSRERKEVKWGGKEWLHLLGVSLGSGDQRNGTPPPKKKKNQVQYVLHFLYFSFKDIHFLIELSSFSLFHTLNWHHFKVLGVQPTSISLLGWAIVAIVKFWDVFFPNCTKKINRVKVIYSRKHA